MNKKFLLFLIALFAVLSSCSDPLVYGVSGNYHITYHYYGPYGTYPNAVVIDTTCERDIKVTPGNKPNTINFTSVGDDDLPVAMGHDFLVSISNGSVLVYDPSDLNSTDITLVNNTIVAHLIIQHSFWADYTGSKY